VRRKFDDSGAKMRVLGTCVARRRIDSSGQPA